MKKLITTVAVITLGTLAFASFASPYGYGQHGNRMENRLERMTEQLNLSDDQQKQIRTLFEKRQQERDARRQEMHSNIKSVLNEEQQARFTEMHSKRQQKRAERMEKRHGKYCDQYKGRRYSEKYDD